MLKKVRKRVKEHIKHFNYDVTEDQEEEISLLYELNHRDYNEDALALHIENFIKNMGSAIDSNWKKERRPTIYATRVDPVVSEVPNFPKSEETFKFLFSRLGMDIPFSFITKEQKESLVESMYPMIIEGGIELITEGAIGSEMYIVESGEFDVSVKGVHVNKQSRGSVMGELALLHGILRTATVTANQRSKIWCVEQTSFSVIRSKDRIYRKEMTKEAIEESEYLMNIIKTEENIERVLDSAKNRFIQLGSICFLMENEVAVIIKAAKINNSNEKSVMPKDVILNTFYAITDVECVILNLK